jgi:hypothetical protein
MLEDSGVERLKRQLYKRGEAPKLKERRELHEIEHEDVSMSWHDEQAEQEQAEQDPQELLQNLYEGRVTRGVGDEPAIFYDERVSERGATQRKKEKTVGSRIIKLIFIVSLFFFLIAAGFATYFLVGGKNQVSCKNVAIAISGPRSIASGKKMSLDVVVKNNNPVPMREAVLEVVYPEGTRDADSSTSALSSTKEQVGTIEVGEQVRTSARAILFGQEQTEKEVRAEITYTIDDSNASFTCNNTHRMVIATAPISMTVEGLEEISSGQEIELKISFKSNSEEVVPEQRLVVEYPFGFTFLSSSPEPTENDNVWDVGDIAPGMERVLTIKGIVEGQGTESRIVGFSVGEADKTSTTELGTVLQKIDHPLFVTRPFLVLEAEILSSKEPKVTTNLGTSVGVVVNWKNTLEYALHDVEIEAIIDGAVLVERSVNSSKGFFRSIDNTLVWSPQTTKEDFRIIEPGESGKLDFTFITKTFKEDTSIHEPEIHIEFKVRARRISDNIPVEQNLQGQSKRTIVFNTTPELDAYAVYATGPFSNTGPYPPKVDKGTTYTVVWSVANSTNDLNSVTVKGVLPVYVQWLENTDPKSETVTYNPVTREVSWSVGDLSKASDFKENRKVVNFQLSFTPSITQIGSRPPIVTSITMQGIDAFTDSVIERELEGVESELTRDPYFMGVSGKITN